MCVSSTIASWWRRRARAATSADWAPAHAAADAAAIDTAKVARFRVIIRRAYANRESAHAHDSPCLPANERRRSARPLEHPLRGLRPAGAETRRPHRQRLVRQERPAAAGAGGAGGGGFALRPR